MSDVSNGHPFRIAIAGLGTVGAGMVEIIQTHAELLARRAGRPIEIAAVSARHRQRERGVDLSAYVWEDNAVALAQRADVDCVIEVIGGSNGPAKAMLEAALSGGKHVVTANKALLAHHGQALAELAEENGLALRYEAAVAGGIPIVRTMTQGMAANRASRIYGVLNGTCNYILTEMERTGAIYADVLAEAQRLGYAEQDPSFDVSGIDAAHKLALLATLAFGTRVDFGTVSIEGIERVSNTDIVFARDLGYRIKLLGVAQISEDGLEQRVQPVLVPADSAVGTLEGVTNAVVADGDFIGKITLTGPGAGAGPTASAIIADVIDIARGGRGPTFGSPAAGLNHARTGGDNAAASYYLRFHLADTPGVLASITAALGDEGVSISRLRQRGRDPEGVPVLIVTHETSRTPLDRALAAIDATEVSLDPPVAIRIERT